MVMKKKDIRYNISKYSIYIFIFCTLFLVQREMILLLFNVKSYVIFNKIYIYEIILAVISFFELYNGVKISRPE